MKELFKKRLKKLTALVVALVMMMLPGQSLLVMAAETYEYDANSIYDYFWTNPGLSFYNKILKPGDTITNSVAVNYSANTPSISGSNTVLDYDTFYKKLMQQTQYPDHYKDYGFLTKYFKGWEVADASASSGGPILTLSPYLQFAHVDDEVALNTDSTVTFQVTLPDYDEIPNNFRDYEFYPSWGYATKVTEEEVISYKKEGANSDKVPKIYFINPEDNEFYLFTPISEESQDENKLTLDLGEAQGKNIVYAQRIEYSIAVARALRANIYSFNDGEGYCYYFSNLAHVTIKEPEQPTTEQKPTTQPTTEQKPATKPSTDAPSSVSKKTYEKNSTTMTLAGKIYWDGEKLVVKWGNLPGADGYDIIATRCGKSKMSNKLLVKTVPAGTTKTFLSKIDGKKLKLIKSYKVQIKAFVGSGTSKQYIGESMVYHSAGKNSPFTNAKKVTLNKKKVVLKVGKTFKLSPNTIKQDKNKKFLSANHAPLYRYLSTNTSVATVNKNGKIKAVGKGSCKVYAIAINGFKASIKVTVK